MLSIFDSEVDCGYRKVFTYNQGDIWLCPKSPDAHFGFVRPGCFFNVVNTCHSVEILMKPWVKMPASVIREGKLKKMLWAEDAIGKQSHKVAALKIFIALCMCAELNDMYCDFGDFPLQQYSAQLTYDRIGELTALSRNSISEGIAVLVRLDIISVRTEGRKNVYRLSQFDGSGNWSKLPCKDILTSDQKRIEAFYQLKLRSKIELYALKMYIYLCTVRDNKTPYASASFEKINEATAIPERDIPRTHAFLSGIGLIAIVEKRRNENAEQSKVNTPNSYYLKGYKSFFITSKK